MAIGAVVGRGCISSTVVTPTSTRTSGGRNSWTLTSPFTRYTYRRGPMIKRIEKWLAGIFKAELKTVEADAAGLYAHLTSEIHELRNELATVIRGFQDASEERASALKSHVDGAAEKITTDVAADAKVISLFRHMQRLACALCG